MVLLRRVRVMWVARLYRRLIIKGQVVVEQAQLVVGLAVDRVRQGQGAVGFFGMGLIMAEAVAGHHIRLPQEQPHLAVMVAVAEAVVPSVALVL